ncbi:DUF4394 domain-containing protein [Chamaesiphon sp.]|uniref:DUF4394 domain-containing protein n=1 Tax=Chamaesiphon sp. TaxID=2814140 RepID=UPI0035934595
MKSSKLVTLVTAIYVATMFEFFGVARSAEGVALTGLTGGNTLVFFDSATPGSTTTRSVTGADGLLGIDYRPADGQLYGITNASVFTIDPSSGNATFFNSISPTFNGGTTSGVDFNPAADALRITGANGQNFRIPGGGSGTTMVDGTIAYATTDTNAGVSPTITASAYTNSFAGAPAGRTTQLFDIDSNLDVLVLQNPANSGTLATIGSLGVNVGTVGGFDIFSPSSGVNIAFAAFAPSGSTAASLYTIDLSSGAATSLGQIGTGAGFNLTGLAAPIPPTAVPEPSSLPGLIIVGIGTGWMLKRRKRKSSAADKQ